MNPITLPEKEPQENGRMYAYRILFEAIMSLEFPPGMLLVDAELSEAMGISRTPIREAIVSLKDAKLVDVHPQKSSSVSLIDLGAVEEGMFVRHQVETGILQDAIKSADTSSLIYLHNNLDEQKSALENGQVDRYMELDNLFHKQLYLSVNKPWTWSTIMRMVTHQDRVRRLQVRLGSEHLWPSYEEHLRIFHMIMMREGAEDLSSFLYQHLTSGYYSALPELIEKYPNYFAL